MFHFRPLRESKRVQLMIGWLKVKHYGLHILANKTWEAENQMLADLICTFKIFVS